MVFYWEGGLLYEAGQNAKPSRLLSVRRWIPITVMSAEDRKAGVVPIAQGELQVALRRKHWRV
jgi:hypothetical protein